MTRTARARAPTITLASDALGWLVDEAGREPGRWRALAVALPHLDPGEATSRLAAAELGDGAPLAAWCAPGEAGGVRWELAGRGDAARLDGHGPKALVDVRRRGQALLASLVERRRGDVIAPAPRLWGGVAFRPDGERRAGGPWRDFADASFALPRWLLGSGEWGGGTFLRLVLAPDDPVDAVAGEAFAIGRALSAPSTPSARSWSALGKEPPSAPLPDDGWEARVAEALGEIDAGHLVKVVVARQARAAATVAPAVALERLRRRYPACARFAFTRGGAVFLGATPERLVLLDGALVASEALAGTTPRDGDDVSAAARLYASDKDRREHALVVAAIRGALAPLCAGPVEAPAVPSLRYLPGLLHLWTPVAGRLAGAAHVLDLVERLHPTPAVCGVPRAAALDWLARREPLDGGRGWYAAPVGWFDARGDGAFVVALRSALLANGEAHLFAGCGIVAGSDPALEREEIALKQAAMRGALGLASELDGSAS